MANVKSRLNEHFKAQHKEINLTPSFLKVGTKPPECKYSNWDQFYEDPDNVALQVADGYTMNTGGKKVDIIPKYKLMNEKKKELNLK